MGTLDRSSRISTFIAAAITRHGDVYDYSRVDAEFVNAHSKVTIGCPLHGTFQQAPNDHKRGGRCPDCAGRRGSSAAARAQQFIAQAQSTHGDRYQYDDVEFVDQHTPVQILCREHGSFPQRPDRHVDAGRPSGCPKCADESRPERLKAAWKRRPRPKRDFEGQFASAA